MTNKLPVRKRNRLEGFDYNSEGYYFITSCVDNKIQCLSEIIEGSVMLKPAGGIIYKYLEEFKIRYDHIVPEVFVIMPNHIHLILFNKRVSSNIGIIQYMSALKTLSSRDIRMSGMNEFKWQRSFYDRIIRDEREYTNIAGYISENPMTWREDIENPQNNSYKTEEKYYKEIIKRCVKRYFAGGQARGHAKQME